MYQHFTFVAVLGTYFSENALLPGLVKGEFNDKHVAKGLYEELKIEADRFPSSMPSSWLSSKMRQIGLEVFSHEYSLNYPMGLGVVSRHALRFKNVFSLFIQYRTTLVKISTGSLEPQGLQAPRPWFYWCRTDPPQVPTLGLWLELPCLCLWLNISGVRM